MRRVILAAVLTVVVAGGSSCSSASQQESLGPDASLNDVVSCVIHLAESRGWDSSLLSGGSRPRITLSHPDEGRIRVTAIRMESGRVWVSISAMDAPATPANVQLREHISRTCTPSQPEP